MTSINRLIQEAIKTKLQADMPTFFTSIGYTAPRIKTGRLQDDPENVSASIMVHVQDPRDDTWRDQPASVNQQSIFPTSQTGAWGVHDGYIISSGRIGGGKTWVRRFMIEVVQFYTQSEDQDTACDITAQVISKICQVVESTDISGLVDSLGERGVTLHVISTRMRESGGPPSDYIWYSEIRVNAETLNPNV